MSSSNIIPLSLDAPLDSLADVTGLNDTQIAAARTPPIKRQAQRKARLAGVGVSLRALRASVEAAGYRLEASIDGAWWEAVGDDIDASVRDAAEVCAMFHIRLELRAVKMTKGGGR